MQVGLLLLTCLSNQRRTSLTHAKKHHFIPQFLLKRFTDTSEKLVVHRLTTGQKFISTVRNVGHRNLGHTLALPGREPDHTSLETAMSAIEGEAATAIAQLASTRSRDVPSELRPALAWFLALQWSRHRFLFHFMRENLKADDGGPLDKDLNRSLMLINIKASVLEPWSLRDDPSARFKELWNPLVSLLLSSEMHWSSYRPRGIPLIVSDTSVCFSGARDGFIPEIPSAYLDHGVGAGFYDMRRVTVPLGSSLGLIISRDEHDAKRIRAAQFNKYTVFNCREFVAYPEGWPARHRDLDSKLRVNLITQRIVSPTFLWGYRGNI